MNKYLLSPQVDEQEERKKRQKTEHKEVSVDEEVRVTTDMNGLSRATGLYVINYETGHNFFDIEHTYYFCRFVPENLFHTRAHNYLTLISRVSFRLTLPHPTRTTNYRMKKTS